MTASHLASSVRVMRLTPLLFVGFLALQMLACTGLSATGPARRGEHEALRRALLDDLREGRLSRDAVRDLAEVVAEREVSEASGPAAVARVQQVGLCARALEDVLDQRAEKSDRAAPLAAMNLLQVDLGDPDTWRERLDDKDPDWRAVAVRTLVDSEHGKQRRAAMLDLDERVRKAAVQAAEEAMDKADRLVLLDVSRHDPNQLVRVTAIRGLGWVASEQDVLAMRDMWATAPSPVQQALVAAWSFPGTLEAGGRRELTWVAETQSGAPAIIAGGILMRLGDPTRGTGIAALRSGMQNGVARDRALAIAMVPLGEPGIRELLEKLSKEAEPKVRVAALAKLAESSEDASKRLGQIAASREPGADDAREAMARIGDRRVIKLLLEDAKSPNRQRRRAALQGFLALDEAARAAFFMADPDPGLRTAAACGILAASARW